MSWELKNIKRRLQAGFVVVMIFSLYLFSTFVKHCSCHLNKCSSTTFAQNKYFAPSSNFLCVAIKRRSKVDNFLVAIKCILLMRIFFYQEQGNADCFGKELIGKTEIKFSSLVLRNNLERLLS